MHRDLVRCGQYGRRDSCCMSSVTDRGLGKVGGNDVGGDETVDRGAIPNLGPRCQEPEGQRYATATKFFDNVGATRIPDGRERRRSRSTIWGGGGGEEGWFSRRSSTRPKIPSGPLQSRLGLPATGWLSARRPEASIETFARNCHTSGPEDRREGLWRTERRTLIGKLSDGLAVCVGSTSC